MENNKLVGGVRIGASFMHEGQRYAQCVGVRADGIIFCGEEANEWPIVEMSTAQLGLLAACLLDVAESYWKTKRLLAAGMSPDGARRTAHGEMTTATNSNDLQEAENAGQGHK